MLDHGQVVTSGRHTECPTHCRLETSRVRRIATNIYQDSTLDDAPGCIELEQGHRCTTHGRQANDLSSFQCKVFLPHVGTRIEQWGDRPRGRIDSAQIRAFPPIAVEARQGKVATHGVATVLAWQDVVNMMGQGDIILMQQAVLALSLRPLSDAPTQRDGNVDRRHAELLRRRGGKASPRFKEQEEMVDLRIGLQFGRLLGGQALFTMRVE